MPDRRRYGRTPDTVLVLTACTVSGVVFLLTDNPPESLTNVIPHWTAVVWSALLAASSLMTLAGVYWHDELIGWALELSGRITLASMLTLYAVVLGGQVTSPGSWLVTALVAGVGAASWWRVRQLTRRLSQWVAALRRAGRLDHHGKGAV